MVWPAPPWVEGSSTEEEAELEALIKQWRMAGQEIAYEVWSLVRDHAQPDVTTSTSSWGWTGQASCANIRKFDDNWGWAEQGDEKRLCVEEERQCTTDLDAGEEPRPQETLGTMLRQLGIDPETLCWDEQAECFLAE